MSHAMKQVLRLTKSLGQISGFLAMEDFLSRFGQFNEQTQKLYFSNVRAGLIVAVVSLLKTVISTAS